MTISNPSPGALILSANTLLTFSIASNVKAYTVISQSLSYPHACAYLLQASIACSFVQVSKFSSGHNCRNEFPIPFEKYPNEFTIES